MSFSNSEASLGGMLNKDPHSRLTGPKLLDHLFVAETFEDVEARMRNGRRVLVEVSGWQQNAHPVMKLYTETTDGSMIEQKDTLIVWCYEDADPDFGSCHLKSFLIISRACSPKNQLESKDGKLVSRLNRM
ncbi:alpha,alpha-trehalose-phosphate synthase [UDP-forming] 6-like protein [Tanacetum coccineum]|uniref:Alpha,alpha-trehalose-phosphate synthase [UDP-forming] 6-like protein n=1 Tax=Tanacetum coccineum TaxID=301880 RepID=A0ABQ4ZGY5_9ASTR